MKGMNHIMIDIETLGTKPGSVILSIAAVEFDLCTGETGREFFRNIRLQDSLNLGLKIDGNTLIWWMNNKAEALKLSTDNGEDLFTVLEDLYVFIRHRGANNVFVWGNSNRFDLGLLEAVYDKVPGTPIPWDFHNERDVRTLVSFAPEIKDSWKKVGVEHHGLSDCINQIGYCSAIWNHLRE